MENLFENQIIAYITLVLIGFILGYLVQILVKFILSKYEPTYKIKIEQFGKSIKFVFPLIFAAISLKNYTYYPFEININSRVDVIIDIILTIAFSFLISEILIFVYVKKNNEEYNKSSSLIHILIRISVFAFASVVISNLLDYDIKAILTALGVGGLAIALALQDTLGNLFAGMHMLASKQLKPGDYIKLDSGEEGYVLDINWRNTEIKTLLENVLVIPNSKISSANVTNYFTLQKNLYFHIPVGVHYDSDLEKVERITLETAAEVLKHYDSIPKGFEPKVRFYEFADSSINFKVWLASDTYESQFLIKHEFVKTLQKNFARENIIIPFPIRTVQIEKSS